jgi:hypothetical protein
MKKREWIENPPPPEEDDPDFLEEMYELFRSQNLLPEELKEDEYRNGYAEWLKMLS